MKHAPSWNKLVEHFHGDDDVVFGDVTLLKNHVRQVCSVNLEPRQLQLAHHPLLQPRYRMRQQRISEEDQPGYAPRTRSKMKHTQQYVKEQGDTPLCNVNRAEKGTATLDEDQGESSHISGRLRHRERIRSSRAPRHRWIVSFELVWRNPADHATTVSAGI